jgi:hypothetical protein
MLDQGVERMVLNFRRPTTWPHLPKIHQGRDIERTPMTPQQLD